MRLSLNEKYELAQKYYGFNKGIAWWWWLRIHCILATLCIFTYPFQLDYYGNNGTYYVLFIWILMIANQFLLGYGLYFVKATGYKCTIISYILHPILFLSFWFIAGMCMMSSSDISYKIASTLGSQIVFSIINILYFRKRKFFFNMTSESECSKDFQNNVKEAATFENDTYSEPVATPSMDIPSDVPISNKARKIVTISLGIAATILLLITIAAAYYINDQNSKIIELKDEIVSLRNENKNNKLKSNTYQTKYNNLIDYIQSYHSMSVADNFYVIDDVVCINEGETYTGIFVNYTPGVFTCYQDNNNVEFEWDEEHSGENGLYLYNITGEYSGCTTLTISHDTETDLSKTILVIVD